MPLTISKVGASQGTFGAGASLSHTRSPGAVGNILIAAGLQTTGGLIISDLPAVDTWVPMHPIVNDTTNSTNYRCWYQIVTTTASRSIRLTGSVGSFCSFDIDEFTGNDLTLPLDQIWTSLAGTGANPVSSAITLGVNNALVWSWIGSNSTPSPGNIDGSAATQGADDGSSDETEYRILTGRTGVAVTAGWTAAAATYELVVASFKPLAAPTVTLNPVSVNTTTGRGATFTAAATTSGGTLHYQWKINGVNDGLDDSTYNIGNVTNSQQNATVVCAISDDTGTSNTSTATLTVNTPTNPFIPQQRT